MAIGFDVEGARTYSIDEVYELGKTEGAVCPNCGTLPIKQFSEGEFLRYFFPDCLTFDSERNLYYFECEPDTFVTTTA